MSEFTTVSSESGPFVVVLGIAQDGGVPQIGSDSEAWHKIELRRKAACLGVVDPKSGQRWLIEATPDIKFQLNALDRICRARYPEVKWSKQLDGIVVTHAHVGHYLGLAFLGPEMMNATGIPLYVLPRMAEFVSTNLPWSDLIDRNIEIRKLAENVPTILSDSIKILPFCVPHRDEHSETAAIRIVGENRSVLFVPDIDSWELYDSDNTSIESEIEAVSGAFVDGTFFNYSEVPDRSTKIIPHPTVMSSIARFSKLDRSEKSKIRFIHLNHSNRLLDPNSAESATLNAAGFFVAEEEEVVLL